MNLENKNIKKLFISLVGLLIIIFGLKQMLGYSPIGYLYNAYYNSIHDSEVINNTYKIQPPFFNWRINEKNNTQVIFYGMLTENGFLKATFSNNSLSKSIDEIKDMCVGRNIVKNIDIDTHKAVDIYCENKNINELNSYKIIFIPKKLFVFMYDYQMKYNNQYEKLISKIVIVE